jgi:hypothetical protein
MFKLTLRLSAAHLLLVVLTLLWLLLQPGAAVPNAGIFVLLMNSLLWGFCGALLFKAIAVHVGEQSVDESQ